MSTHAHYRKLERMHLSTPFNSFHFPSASMYISEERAEITMDTNESYFHCVGSIHSNVYMKMMEDAAFFAANSIIEDVLLITTSFNVSLFKPVNRGFLRAIGKLKFKSKQTYISECRLFNSNGKEIGMGSGSFMKSRILLEDSIGYQ